MTIAQISSALEAAGCVVKVWKDTCVYVYKTPNGKRGDYGYCVEGENVSDICESINNGYGDIAAILRNAIATKESN